MRVWPSITLKKSKIQINAATALKQYSWIFELVEQNVECCTRIQTSITSQWTPHSTNKLYCVHDANTANANTRGPITSMRHMNRNTRHQLSSFALLGRESRKAFWYAASAHEIDPRDVTHEMIWPIPTIYRRLYNSRKQWWTFVKVPK